MTRQGTNYTQNSKVAYAAQATAQPNCSPGPGQTVKPKELSREAKRHQAHQRSICGPPAQPFGFEEQPLTSLAPPPLRRSPAHSTSGISHVLSSLGTHSFLSFTLKAAFPSLAYVLHSHCTSGAISGAFQGNSPKLGVCGLLFLSHYLGCLPLSPHTPESNPALPSALPFISNSFPSSGEKNKKRKK